MVRLKSPHSFALAAVVVFSIVLSSCAPAATPTAMPAPTMPAATAAPTDTAVPPTATATEVPPAELTGSLNVLDWSGYDQPDFWTDFQRTYPKVKVSFEIGASDADIYSKMKAGDQSDIFHPYSGFLQFYVDNNLVQPIDTSKLSNWDRVPDSFKKLGQINGKQYFLPWDWGYSSIMYRTDKIPGGVDSWAALLDPKYKGHISMWDDGTSAIEVSSYIHGWDETKVTADQLAQIKQEWIDQSKLNLFYWSGEPELIQGFQNGDVWVAYAWQGTYAQLKAKNVPVAYITPKEGINSWVGFYGIRAGSPNYDLALRFLDEKLGFATGTNVVNEFYYGDSNQEVMNSITDPTLKAAFGINDPSILQHTNFTPNYTQAQLDAATAMWTDVKAAP